MGSEWLLVRKWLGIVRMKCFENHEMAVGFYGNTREKGENFSEKRRVFTVQFCRVRLPLSGKYFHSEQEAISLKKMPNE